MAHVSTVTVIIPHYRSERYLRQAAESILLQDDVDLQVWIIDDASDGREWLETLRGLEKDERLVLYQSSRNVGPYRLKNAVLPLIQSPFVALQDADDCSDLRRLRIQLEAMRRTGADVMGCGFRYLSADSESVRPSRRLVRNCNLWLRLGKTCVILHPTSIMRREIFETLGGFDGSARFAADDDFTLRTSLAFRIRNVKDVMYSYRVHSDSLTCSPQTGFGSKARNEYLAAMWARHRARRRLRNRGELLRSLRAPANDIAFELRRLSRREIAADGSCEE